MAARNYKRKSKVYTTRRATPVKNKWTFRDGRISRIGIVTMNFWNKTPGAKYREKRVSIDVRGPLQIVYMNDATRLFDMYEVKRSEKALNSYRKYKNKLIKN